MLFQGIYDKSNFGESLLDRNGKSSTKHTNMYVCRSENYNILFVEMKMVLSEGSQDDRSRHDSTSNNMVAYDHFHKLSCLLFRSLYTFVTMWLRVVPIRCHVTGGYVGISR